MKVLFLDCFSGISGDMMVGALCDLGVKPSALEWELSKVEIGDFHMHFERAQRQHIEGVHFSIHAGATHSHAQDTHEHEHDHHHTHVHADGTVCHHDHGREAAEHAHSHKEEEHSQAHEHGVAHTHTHEHEHAHGEHAHSHEHTHEHSHTHEHGHEEEDDHAHAHAHQHHHEHEHGRSHAEIRQLIESSELSPFVKEHALGIFARIAQAEGKIHGMPPADVTFHEVGALDSIADIICACVGIEALGVNAVYVSDLHEGTGTIECAHGTFPLPAPATLEILAGIPISAIDETHELITPTGAAIVAEFGKSFGLMPRLTTEKIGYGVGSRDLASRPNVLRAVLGELAAEV